MELPWPNPEEDERPLAGSNAGRQQPAAGSSDPVQAILDVIGRGKRFLVCSHARPDGDAMGSVLACGMLLEQMGKHADVVAAGGVPLLYRGLPGAASIQTVQRLAGAYDAAILLECDGVERTGLTGLENYFLINIDHHMTGRAFAQLNWIDCEASSVGELVYRLAKAAGATLTPEIAACLYATVLTDTGGFSYGSIRPSTFELARDLVAAGADPVGIAREFCYSTPISKMLLLGAALSNLHSERNIAWLWVTQQDMIRAGAADEDSEGLVNFAIGIAGIEAAVFLRQLEDGRVRASLRSKGDLNVAAIAEQLGGGGHRNAAGCTLDGPLEPALKRILDILRRENFASNSARHTDCRIEHEPTQ